TLDVVHDIVQCQGVGPIIVHFYGPVPLGTIDLVLQPCFAGVDVHEVADILEAIRLTGHFAQAVDDADVVPRCSDAFRIEVPHARTDRAPPRRTLHFNSENEQDEVEWPSLVVVAVERIEDVIDGDTDVELETEFRELGEL